MRSFLEPGPGLRPLLVILRLYLCLFIVGCTAHRPPVAEIRSMQTRLMLGDERTVFDACVGTLQDLGYGVEISDAEGGVLTASRATHDRSGAITREEDSERKKGMPTWGKVLLVATGVIVIVAIVSVLTGHDDGDKAPERGASKDSTRYKGVPEHEGKVARRHHHHERDETPRTDIVLGEPAPPTLYEYRITIHLRAKGDDATQVRASLEGRERQGGEIVRSGAVDDPDFFARFFAALDRSVRLEQREQGIAPGESR